MTVVTSPRAGNTTAKVHAYDGSYTKSELARRNAEAYGLQPCTFTCSECAWRFEGTVADGLALARAHRAVHGYVRKGRRR